MNAATEYYLREHAALKASLPGGKLDWLNTSRAQALSQLEQRGFPTVRDEDWKYTSIRPIEKRRFKFSQSADDAVDAETLNRYLCKDMACHLLVFVDGHYSAKLSNTGKLPSGLKIKDLATALDEDNQLMQDHLGSIADDSRNGFAAMNLAFMHSGALVTLDDNTQPDWPVHLMFLSSGKQADITSQSRILILAGRQAQAKIIESYIALEEAVYFNNITTEIKLDQGAHIEHFKVQKESLEAFHVATLQVEQQRDSTFTSHSVSMGAQLARNDINCAMVDEGASCNLYGLYVTGGKQHADFHTRIDHAKPHCNSNEYYKGILDGRSRAVFNGQVHVHRDAQKSAAQQANKNLLLSRHAEVDTKPQLEIYADDVTAAHGATVGQLDEDMLFYLRTRGISYDAAYALLVYGFAHDIIKKMSIEPLQQHLETLLVSRIPNADQFSDLIEGHH